MQEYMFIYIQIRNVKKNMNAIITLKCILYHICDAVVKFWF